MTEPGSSNPQPKRPEAPTGILPAARRDEPMDAPVRNRDALDHFPQLDQLPTAADSDRYEMGPLFSRKVLFGWAFAALAVWFAVTFIVPEVVKSVGAEIRNNIGRPGSTVVGDGLRVTRNADGSVTVTRGGRVIVTTPPEPTKAIPTPPAPVVIPTPPVPPVAPAPSEKKTPD